MPVAERLSRSVVLHADDFGMNSAVNAGILSAFGDGLLTSTSLLANASEADTACQSWRELISDHQALRLKSTSLRKELHDPEVAFDLGIHLNLTQGRPLTGDRYPAELLDDQGNFPGIGKVFFGMRALPANQLPAVESELRQQIGWMCDVGLKPTHLNGHQYVELIPQIATMIPELLRHFSIPAIRVADEPCLAISVLAQWQFKDWILGMVKRHFARQFRSQLQTHKVRSADRYFGTCHAGKIDLQTLETYLNCSGRSSTIEVGLHPGTATNNPISTADPWFDPLRSFRPQELEMLCSAQLGDLLKSRQWRLGRLSQLTT